MTNYGPAKSYEFYQSCSVSLTQPFFYGFYGWFVAVTFMIVADVHQSIFSTLHVFRMSALS